MSCGKKGPPFLPESDLSLRVDGLTGSWEEGSVDLVGRVQDDMKQASDVSGCKVYHAWYPMDDPPCEGCPVEVTELQEKTGNVITKGRFRCRIQIREKRGIHFFQVRLVGKNGVLGPVSNRVKLKIDD